MPGWSPGPGGRVPEFVSSFMPADPAVLWTALAVLAIPFLVGGLLDLPAGEADRPGTLFVGLLAAGLATNALGHLGQALLVGGYVPGLATGIGVCVPYAAWLLRRLRSDGLLSTRGLWGSVVASAVLQVPFLLGVVAAARWAVG